MKKVREFSQKCYRKTKKFLVATCATLSMASIATVPVSAATTIKDISTATFVGGILDVIFEIAKWTGAVVAVIGIFMFLYSFKDDRSDLQANGAKMAIVGGALLGLRALVKLTGLIS